MRTRVRVHPCCLLLSLLACGGCPPADAPSDDGNSSTDGPSASNGSAGPPAPVLAEFTDEVAGSSVTLHWFGAPEVEYYEVYIGAQPDPPLLRRVPGTSLEFINLAPCLTYYWRVRARSPAGTTNSALGTFATACPQAPPIAPRYPAPANDEQAAPVQPTLQWAPAPAAERYEVYFGAPSNPPYLTTTAQPRLTLGSELQAGGLYFWRVVAVNADGQSSSPVWRFEVRSNPRGLNTPINLSPPNRSTDLPTRVRLRWTAVDGARSYDVYLAPSDTAPARVANVPDPLYDSDTLNFGTEYAWHVVALGAGDSTAGSNSTFITATEPLPPNEPIGPSPADGASSVFVDVELSWEPVSNADSYEVYLGTSTDPPLAATSTDTRFQPTRVLEPGKTYFWRVVAINPQGRSESATWHFISRVIAPPDFDGDPFGGEDLPCARAVSGVAKGTSDLAVVSLDGQVVAFVSGADDLAPGDTNHSADVFALDRRTGQVTRVNIRSDGAQALGVSGWPSVSADGRYVAFHSTAVLDAADTDALEDIYVHDRVNGTTRLATPGSSARCRGPSVSGDGRYVAFQADGPLSSLDQNGVRDVYVADAQTGKNELASRASDGRIGDDGVDGAVLSANGRYVAFVSRATNFGGGGTGHRANLYVRDREAGTLEVINPAEVGAITPSISASGQIVAYTAHGAEGDPVIVQARDRATGETILVSENFYGQPGAVVSWLPSVSGDGRFVFFNAFDNAIAPGDNNDDMDVFRRDLATRKSLLISGGWNGEPASGTSLTFGSASYGCSFDGRVALFLSNATNLVPDDADAGVGLFLFECAE